MSGDSLPAIGFRPTRRGEVMHRYGVFEDGRIYAQAAADFIAIAETSAEEERARAVAEALGMLAEVATSLGKTLSDYRTAQHGPWISMLDIGRYGERALWIGTPTPSSPGSGV